MSVLSFPRIYFSGFMEWNQNTSNNNDYVPTYDPANAALTWDFLAQQQPPITRENFRETFRPWVIKPLADVVAGGPSDNCNTCTNPGGTANPNCHMPSRWNYYGDNGCSFVQYQEGSKLTLATGGDLAYNTPAASGDPILQKPLLLAGNTFGGRGSSARLIDINPISPFCSQIYFASFKVGDAQTYVGGPAYHRMFSRSFFVPRNISEDLIIAGAIGVIFQTTIPGSTLQSGNSEGSPLLAALLEAMQAPGAAGLMLRFATYNTVYYQNGVYNNTQEQPRTCEDLTKLYSEGKVFLNPAYSPVAGAIGVWNQGELSTAPGGRMLVPRATVTPVSPAPAAAKVRRLSLENLRVAGHASVSMQAEGAASPEAATAPSGPPPLALGVVFAEIDWTADLVALDLMNAIPEFTVDGVKFDYGPIDVGVQLSNGTFEVIGSFGFDQYDRQAYLAKGGLVDVPFSAGLTGSTIQGWLAQGGVLALRAGTTIASVEAPLTVETDDRGVYVDQCRIQEIQLQVRAGDDLPPAGTRVRVAQYYPWPLREGTGSWVLFGTLPAPPYPPGDVPPTVPYVTFPDGDVVDVGADGTATVRIAANAPGFPNLAFYPFLAGQPVPEPQAQVGFGFSAQNPTQVRIGTAFYSAVRVMPFDNELVAQFVDRWNGTGVYSGQPKYDRTLAWQFIYDNIFYAYDMIYPVMEMFMPFGNLVRVEGAIDQLLMMISEDFLDSTLYMPVTRELSAGKRLILQAWGGLVTRKYPQEDLPPLAVPCDVG